MSCHFDGSLEVQRSAGSLMCASVSTTRIVSSVMVKAIAAPSWFNRCRQFRHILERRDERAPERFPARHANDRTGHVVPIARVGARHHTQQLRTTGAARRGHGETDVLALVAA